VIIEVITELSDVGLTAEKFKKQEAWAVMGVVVSGSVLFGEDKPHHLVITVETEIRACGWQIIYLLRATSWMPVVCCRAGLRVLSLNSADYSNSPASSPLLVVKCWAGSESSETGRQYQVSSVLPL
jgi:hypothetical protein